MTSKPTARLHGETPGDEAPGAGRSGLGAGHEAPDWAIDLADDGGEALRLDVDDVAAVARGRRRIEPLREDPAQQRALERHMRASAEWVTGEVTRAAANGDARPVYGVNTGFGALAGRQAFDSSYLDRVLSRNLLVSHAAGTGPTLDEDVVRAAALIRCRQLTEGYSGIRIEVVNRLIGVLNEDIFPVVPAYGSLGASGDLAPLAHLALVISKAPADEPGSQAQVCDPFPGEVWIEAGPDADDAGAAAGEATHRTDRDPATGRTRVLRRAPATEAMARAGGQLELGAKEGLALSNGATVSAALLCLAVSDAKHLIAHAELAAAMTLEALRGFRDAFLPAVHDARPHPGAKEAAGRVLAYVDGSTLLDPASETQDPLRVPPQDPYSVRCAPQVLGAARDAVDFARRTVETEINSAVDNPLIFVDLPRGYKAVSCGNFHGAPLAYALDLIKIVLTDIAGMSERRAFKLLDYRFEDPHRAETALPPFLVPPQPGLEGLNSGLMIPQYTAASLVSASKTLAHPDSVDTIPSSANQEDHVSMSMNAGLHARSIVDACEGVIAIELLCAAQALDLRREQGRPGRGVAAAWQAVREIVPPVAGDRALHRDIAALRSLVRSGELVRAARGAGR